MQMTSAFLITVSLVFVLMMTSTTSGMAVCLIPIFFIACFIWRSFIFIPGIMTIPLSAFHFKLAPFGWLL